MDSKLLKEKAHTTIILIYNHFRSYFESGDLIVAGSYFYDHFDLSVNKTFKDIDLIVDVSTSNDHILYELRDFFKDLSILNEDSSFIKAFTPGWLIGCLVFTNDYPPIDILRQDFTTNLSSFEIFPGIFTDYQSSEKLVEVYSHLIEGFKNSGRKETIKKFETLRDFYSANSTEKLVNDLLKL